VEEGYQPIRAPKCGLFHPLWRVGGQSEKRDQAPGMPLDALKLASSRALGLEAVK